LYAFQQIQNFDYVGAATTATVLLVVSAVVLALLDFINRRVSARG
jgi:ABC-type sulfate transport system permease component